MVGEGLAREGREGLVVPCFDRTTNFITCLQSASGVEIIGIIGGIALFCHFGFGKVA